MHCFSLLCVRSTTWYCASRQKRFSWHFRHPDFAKKGAGFSCLARIPYRILHLQVCWLCCLCEWKSCVAFAEINTQHLTRLLHYTKTKDWHTFWRQSMVRETGTPSRCRGWQMRHSHLKNHHGLSTTLCNALRCYDYGASFEGCSMHAPNIDPARTFKKTQRSLLGWMNPRGRKSDLVSRFQRTRISALLSFQKVWYVSESLMDILYIMS